MEWIVAILVSLAYWIGFFVAYFIIFKPFDLVMTKEEKAKAYDEALERARKMMDSKRSVVIGKQALETIFPELAESEDERIRKELIEFIQWAEDRGMTRHDYHQAKRPAEWIAYLEKQKEQDWNKKPCLTCQEYEKGHKQGYTEGCTAGYNKAMKEMEQKEQKPEEVKDPFSNANFVRGYESGYADAKREQKPAEWSEEDERILKGIIGLIDHNQHYGVGNKEMLAWLEELHTRLTEEPVSDCHDLDKEIASYLREECSADDEPSISEIARHFAEWQKAKMMKRVVNADVNTYEDLASGKRWVEFVVKMPTNNIGDKAKIIIVK